MLRDGPSRWLLHDAEPALVLVNPFWVPALKHVNGSHPLDGRAARWATGRGARRQTGPVPSVPGCLAAAIRFLPVKNALHSAPFDQISGR